MDQRELRPYVEPPHTNGHLACPHCGAPSSPAWNFCGSCGRGTVSRPVGHDDPHAAGDLQRSDRRPWRAVVIVPLVLVGLVLLGLAGLAGYIQVQTQRDLDATRTALAESQMALAHSRDELESTGAELAGAESAAKLAKERLSATSTELAETKQRLGDNRRRLSGLRGSLNNAEDRLDLQANQIETLKSCLNGVTEAMGYAAYSDYGAALAALRAVEVSCTRAYELF